MADDRLMAFWVSLVTDPMKHEAWLRDAQAAMEAAGLDEAERAIAISGNARAIYGRLTRNALPPASPPPAALPEKD